MIVDISYLNRARIGTVHARGTLAAAQGNNIHVVHVALTDDEAADTCAAWALVTVGPATASSG